MCTSVYNIIVSYPVYFLAALEYIHSFVHSGNVHKYLTNMIMKYKGNITLGT